MKPTPTLTKKTAARLQAAHEDRKVFEPGLLAIVVALRRAGWPLQSIAEPLGVSREIVRVWERKAADLTDLPRISVEAPPEYVTKEEVYTEEVAMRRMSRDAREARILADALPRLKELKDDAESLRGPSRHDPVKSGASREYTQLLNDTLAKGVRTRVLAEALGIKEITIHARLRRGGFRKMAPSESRPAWAEHTYNKTSA